MESGAWAFVHGPNKDRQIESGRLEDLGPFGTRFRQNSNRAALRAAIAALRYRYWSKEGFDVMVIATDSEYVVDGATRMAIIWFRSRWQTRYGDAIQNQDLWEVLLGEVEKHHRHGLKVMFWKIPEEWNEVAGDFAKALSESKGPHSWVDFMDIYF
jgi:ribonuclease HI